MKKKLIIFLCLFLLLSCETTDNENIEDLSTQFIEETIPEFQEIDTVKEDIALPEVTEIPADIIDREIIPEIVQLPENIPLIDEVTGEILPTDILPNEILSEGSEAPRDIVDREIIPEITQVPEEVPLIDEMADEATGIAQTDVSPDTALPEIIEVPASDILDEEIASEIPQIVEDSRVTTQVPTEIPGALQLPTESKIPELLAEVEVVLEEPAIESAPIILAQSIEVNEGQYIDILFPGQGWIYLGEVDTTEPVTISFSNRRTEGLDTLFILQGKNTGSTILHFYKQDVLENAYIDEYIEVIVMPQNDSMDSTVSILAGGLEEAIAGISSEPEVSLVQIPRTDDVVEDENINLIQTEVSLDELFEQAQIAYNEQRYADSLMLLDNYFAQAVDQLDRAWLLHGQIYESNSDVRNIRKALDAYETLVVAFPDSTLWDEAKKRITYIERFYFNIR